LVFIEIDNREIVGCHTFGIEKSFIVQEEGAGILFENMKIAW
jgi:hypothetical protein